MKTFDVNNLLLAYAMGTFIKGGVQKINIVANIIRGMPVGDALLQLQFCKRRLAKDLKAILSSAIANAENNYNMDVDKLYVSSVLVGKSMTLKRFKPKARGRAGRIQKRFSKVSIFVAEREG